MVEIFKDISWYEGLYQVSNKGNIKSLWNNLTKKEKILKFQKHTKWYMFVVLSKNNIKKIYTVHRLVCLAFLDNPENKPCVNHRNWIKLDNKLENLEWCTYSENSLHNFNTLWYKCVFQTNHPKTLLWKFWKEHNRSKKVNQYTLEWEFIKTWGSIIDIKRELWIDNICHCCKWENKTAKWFIWKYN